MPRISLISGAYSAKSLIASAQRSVNLYPEKNPDEIKSPAPMTHYPRPANTLLGSPTVQAPGRCLYVATNGDLYAVVGQSVYYIDPNWAFNLIGQLTARLFTPAYIADNGVNALIVDGSAQGYNITLTGRTLALVVDPNFSGADRVDFIDSFIVFNQRNSPNWQCTISNQLAFNGLFFGTKTAWPDNIISVISIEREVWLLGPYKGEVWYNAGTTPFPFQILPGTIIEQGCAAKYSVAKMDTNIYWLSQSPEGDRMVMRGAAHQAQRISTHAMEAEFRKYATISDAVGSCYQIDGHSFYRLHFPTVSKTWAFDEATKQWFEDNWIDTNGILRRSRVAFTAFAYGKNVGLDWQTGQLYLLDTAAFTDNGKPIAFIRSFPHVIGDEFERLSLWTVRADMEVGNSPGTAQAAAVANAWSSGFSSGFNSRQNVGPPMITMRISRTRGASWDNGRMQSLGSAGQYFTRPTWRRCGMAYDAVLEFSWSAPYKTALNGAFISNVEGHDD